MPDIVSELDPAGVRLVTLNRPETLNAMTPAIEQAYYDELADAERDPATRVVVVTGAGRGFYAGADISVSVDELIAGGPPLPIRSASSYGPQMATPIIAAINGGCAGLGLAIALHADIRFLAESARLRTAFVKGGLIAEHRIAWLLPRIVAQSRALDLLLSACVITGSDALEYGLAGFMAPASTILDDALTYVRTLAAECSPRAVAIVKRQLAEEAAADSFAALLTADEWTRESFTWPDVREGVHSWQDRRPPEFPGWSSGPSAQEV
jgi:enoyl-CoA hydratase/carnithine racemase